MSNNMIGKHGDPW